MRSGNPADGLADRLRSLCVLTKTVPSSTCWSARVLRDLRRSLAFQTCPLHFPHAHPPPAPVAPLPAVSLPLPAFAGPSPSSLSPPSRLCSSSFAPIFSATPPTASAKRYTGGAAACMARSSASAARLAPPAPPTPCVAVPAGRAGCCGDGDARAAEILRRWMDECEGTRIGACEKQEPPLDGRRPSLSRAHRLAASNADSPACTAALAWTRTASVASPSQPAAWRAAPASAHAPSSPVNGGVCPAGCGAGGEGGGCRGEGGAFAGGGGSPYPACALLLQRSNKAKEGRRGPLPMALRHSRSPRRCMSVRSVCEEGGDKWEKNVKNGNFGLSPISPHNFSPYFLATPHPPHVLRLTHATRSCASVHVTTPLCLASVTQPGSPSLSSRVAVVFPVVNRS